MPTCFSLPFLPADTAFLSRLLSIPRADIDDALGLPAPPLPDSELMSLSAARAAHQRTAPGSSEEYAALQAWRALTARHLEAVGSFDEAHELYEEAPHGTLEQREALRAVVTLFYQGEPSDDETDEPLDAELTSLGDECAN
jgi:hypothetical protein